MMMASVFNITTNARPPRNGLNLDIDQGDVTVSAPQFSADVRPNPVCENRPECFLTNPSGLNDAPWSDPANGRW